MTVYLVEKIWTDSLENSFTDALGYKPIGYVTDPKEMGERLDETIEGTGWPLKRGEKMPKYRITKLEQVGS